MTTQAEFDTAVVTAIALAAELDASAVVWGNSGNPIAPVWVRLFVTADRDVTEPLQDRTYNEETHTFALTLSVMREFTVQVRCETLANEGASSALALSGAIRLALRQQNVVAALAAQGIVCEGPINGSSDVSFDSGEFRIAARTFDILLRAVLSKADPDPLGTIDSIGLSATVENPDIVFPEESIP